MLYILIIKGYFNNEKEGYIEKLLNENDFLKNKLQENKGELEKVLTICK